MIDDHSTLDCPVPEESEPETAPQLQLPALTTLDVMLFTRLERQLSSEKTPLHTIATALATIKTKGLTRITGLSFQEYCDQRLRLKRSRVHQLIDFAEMLEITAKSGILPTADAERQLRPLKQLPRGDWADAWTEAVRTSPAGKISGKHVQAVVDSRLARILAAQVPAPAPASDESSALANTPTPILPDAATSVPSTTPPPPVAHEFTRTVPASNVPTPGWKDAWVTVLRDTSRPPASLRSGVFGWQPAD